MKAVIFATLKQRRWSILGWSIGIFGLIFINMIFYPSFKDQAADLEKTFANLPEAAVQLFGGSTDFFSPIGFLNSQIFFLMQPMLLSILSISLGSSLVGVEEKDNTIEAILARPISRARFLGAKALSGMGILLIVTLAGALTTLITGRIVGLTVGVWPIILANIACYLLVLSVGAIAFALAATGKARSASLGIGATIALGGYLISSLAGTVSWLKAPSKLFPFHYYQTESILSGISNYKNFMFFIVVIVICAVVSLVSFRRRDLN